MPHASHPVEKLLGRFPLRRCDSGHGGVSYRDAGGGAAIVLLHGLSNQSGSWVRQLETLARDFRVLAWDAPGYGESEPLAQAAPAARDYAAALAHWLDAIGIERAVLVGSSLGALMAVAFAAESAARVFGMVLLNPAGGYGRADPREREEKLAARLNRLAQLGPHGMARELSPGMLSQSADEEARALAAWSASGIRPGGYAQAARMLARAALTEDAAKYPGPVLVVSSSADTIAPEAKCRHIAQAFARSAYRLLEGPGHLSYLEAPATVNALIADSAADWLRGSAAP